MGKKKIEELSLEKVLEERNHNSIVLVIGESGSGKSSLINHLIGQEVAKVSDVNRGTTKVSGYRLTDNLIICDTRGTNEINEKDDQTWKELDKTICLLNPDLVLLCVEGYKREAEGLSVLFQKINSLLDKAFKETRTDPKLGIVINKVDILVDGRDNLPPGWFNISNEGGRKINEKQKQINLVFNKELQSSELFLLEPTCLEWGYGAEPWNLEEIRNKIINSFSEIPSKQLEKLVIAPKDSLTLLATKVNLTRSDMITSYDVGKKKWLEHYIKINKYKHNDIADFTEYWKEVFKDNSEILVKILKDEILSFVPYFQKVENIKETIKNFVLNTYVHDTVKNFFAVYYDNDSKNIEEWNKNFQSNFAKIEAAIVLPSNWFDKLNPGEGLLNPNSETFLNDAQIILPAFYPIFYSFIKENINLYIKMFSINENYLITTKILSLYVFVLDNNKYRNLVYFIENRIARFKFSLENDITSKNSAEKEKLKEIIKIFKNLFDVMTELRKKKKIIFYREEVK